MRISNKCIRIITSNVRLPCLSISRISSSAVYPTFFHKSRSLSSYFSTTSSSNYDVVICGAGLAGITSAYYLVKKHNINRVVLLDCRPPMGLTSSMSTECYRDFWPTNIMHDFMTHSINLMEERATESNNAFHMTQTGYAFFCSEKGNGVNEFENMADRMNKIGQTVRVHEDNLDHYPYYNPIDVSQPGKFPSGVDIIKSRDLVRSVFPCTNADMCLHARRGGYLSATGMGSELLDSAKEAGVKVIRGGVIGIDVSDRQVNAVHVRHERTGEEEVIYCGAFVNAAGPNLNVVHQFLPGGAANPLPIKHEIHGKVMLQDVEGIVPRSSPMMIWSDSQKLSWDEEMREFLLDFLGETKAARLLDTMPPGVHLRPEGQDWLLLLWECWHLDINVSNPPIRAEDIEFDELYPEIVIRGLSRMIPGLEKYIDNMPKCSVDGGYYVKTKENLPLIGGVMRETLDNAYVCGALGGFGIMGGNAAGELLSDWVAEGGMPSSSLLERSVVEGISPERYDDPEYLQNIDMTTVQI